MIREKGVVETCQVEHASFACNREPGHDGMCFPEVPDVTPDRETAVAADLRTRGS